MSLTSKLRFLMLHVMRKKQKKKTQAERGNLLTTKSFFRSVAGSFEALHIKIYARVQMWQREGYNKNARTLSVNTLKMLCTIKSNYSPIATLPSRSFSQFNSVSFFFCFRREKSHNGDGTYWRIFINANQLMQIVTIRIRNINLILWRWRYERGRKMQSV